MTPVFNWQGLALRAVIAKEGRKRRVFESRPRSQLRHRAQGSHLLLSQQGAWLATNVQWEARSAIDRFPASLVEEQVGWGPRLGLPYKVTEQVTRSHGSKMVFVTRNQPLLSYRSLFGASYESKTNTKKESFLLLNFPVFSILVYFPD